LQQTAAVKNTSVIFNDNYHSEALQLIWRCPDNSDKQTANVQIATL